MKKLGVLAALTAAFGVILAVGSYAVAGGAKDKVTADDGLIGYLEGGPPGPVSTAARGSFEATIDDEAREIHYTLSYSGLEGDVRQSHIHFGQRSISAGISLWLCETAANPRPVGSPDVPDCVQSGTITGTAGASHVVGPTGQGIAPGEFEELVAAIRAGRAYVNVHSAKFPSGEIRGQLNDSNQRDD